MLESATLHNFFTVMLLEPLPSKNLQVALHNPLHNHTAQPCLHKPPQVITSIKHSNYFLYLGAFLAIFDVLDLSKFIFKARKSMLTKRELPEAQC